MASERTAVTGGRVLEGPVSVWLNCAGLNQLPWSKYLASTRNVADATVHRLGVVNWTTGGSVGGTV
jgi:hypothetical protein